jgi:hypothetical protein
MPPVTRLTIDVPPGYASTEIASFVAQLDDQLRRLTIDTRGLTAADLEWQPAPGMNTMGMLLAHLAIVEVFWTGLILEDLPREAADARLSAVLAMGSDDDGMPLAPAGSPPAALAGRDLAWFDDKLGRAREHLKRVASPIAGAQLTKMFERARPNGDVRVIEMRWTLYHMLEHFAGHYGQILLLKHARRAMAGGLKAGAGSRVTAKAGPRGRARPARSTTGAKRAGTKRAGTKRASTKRTGTKRASMKRAAKTTGRRPKRGATRR